MPFIIPIVGLVMAALGLTLYLSTSAAEDSYSLESARQTNQLLSDKRDNLKRTVDSGDSAPELSDKAAKLGMVPAVDAPQLVIGPDGKGKLVGDFDAEQNGKRLGSLNPIPDPVNSIDVSKVDDSGGLGGTPAPVEASAAVPAPNAQAPNAQAPAAQTPLRPGSPSEGPVATAPGPNVLPANAATPNRNPQRPN